MALLTVAICLHVAGRVETGNVYQLSIIRSREEAISHIHYSEDSEMIHLTEMARTLNSVGTLFTIAGVVSFALAFCKREPGFYSIPILLLFFDLMMLLLL